MKTWRVSTNVVGWIKAETPEGALSMFTVDVQKDAQKPSSNRLVEAISVEDVYDVTEIEPATERED